MLRPAYTWIAVATAWLSLGTSACDDSAVWHRMHPTLERMLEQRRGDPYAPSPTFADGRAMRTPSPGTLAWGEETPPMRVDGGFVDELPYPLTRDLLARGRAEFEITCAACHGILGDGECVVATKMTLRPPPSLHIDRIRTLPVGELADVIANGYGLMPSYAAMLPAPQDVWAVAAYVEALQFSQHARVAALPRPIQDELNTEAP